MRVRIVSYEDVNAWILGKFARKLHEELLKLGVEADISNEVDKQADINHHIIYLGYDELANFSNRDTLMVTHIDHVDKLNILKRQMSVARLGICMSKATADDLMIAGVPGEKLCYVNPAHDGLIPPKKYIIGITSKVQPDGCKREGMLLELADRISPHDFEFRIMGMGWDNIVGSLRSKGFEMVYYPDFDYNEYIKLMPSLDYYLYLGQDEGSMGFIDALATGVKTIITPQGYHLDTPNGITHAFDEIDELVNIFKKLSEERHLLTEAVATWTWKDYALKHLELWEFLMEPGQKIKSQYADGINSLINKTIPAQDIIRKKLRYQYQLKLYLSGIRKKIYSLRKVKDFKTLKMKVKKIILGSRKS